MADTLLIHFNPASDTHTWSTVNDAGELTGKISQGPLQDAAELAATHRTVVLLDNTVLHLSTVEMPAMNQQKLLRAIPFAMEEQLADDIEDMHIVFSRKHKTAPVTVAAIARDTMQGIVDTLQQAGIEAAAVLPDCLCLAANDAQWSALFHDDQVNFQNGELTGNEYDRDLFATVLQAELTSAEQAPQKLYLFTSDDSESDNGLADIDALAGDDTEVIHVSYNTHPVVVYCGNYRQAMPLNLLQHEFKPVRTGIISWQKWSVAAGLGVLWLAANMGLSFWELQQLRQENDALQAESIQIYRSTFPESKRIINPRLQMEQKLDELKAGGAGKGSSIITLLASSAPALSQEQTVQLRSLSYRNGRLDITVDSKNLNSIQSLNTRLNSVAGIRSEIISSSSEKDAVRGSIRVQQAAS